MGRAQHGQPPPPEKVRNATVRTLLVAGIRACAGLPPSSSPADGAAPSGRTGRSGPPRDDPPDACRLGLELEPHRAVEAVRVGDGEGRIAARGGGLGPFSGRAGPRAQRVMGVADGDQGRNGVLKGCVPASIFPPGTKSTRPTAAISWNDRSTAAPRDARPAVPPSAPYFPGGRALVSAPPVASSMASTSRTLAMGSSSTSRKRGQDGNGGALVLLGRLGGRVGDPSGG